MNPNLKKRRLLHINTEHLFSELLLCQAFFVASKKNDFSASD